MRKAARGFWIFLTYIFYCARFCLVFLPMGKKESGQTLIVILLVVATSLLVGAGVATRSTSLIQQTTFSEESTQALHFAEGCAEQALGMIKRGDITQADAESGKSYCCDIDSGTCTEKSGVCDKSTNDCEFSVDPYDEFFVGVVDQDDVVEIKLDEMNPADCDSLYLYWCLKSENCNDVDSQPHGLEVSAIYDDGGEYKIWKEIYGDTHTHHFTTPERDLSFKGEEFSYGELIEFSSLPVASFSDLKAVRLTPRFESFHINVDYGGCDIGFQGFDIHSSGWYGRSTRKVRVTRGEPAMPAIFDYSMFSGSETQPLEKR